MSKSVLKPVGSLQQIDEAEKILLADIAAFYDDPYGFVRYVFQWGEGQLEDSDGPDIWQTKFLKQLGDKVSKHGLDAAIRMATTSGHGVGKSCLVAWVILWFISTRENPQVVVTANTQSQLTTKTWRELAKWHRHALNRHWFVWTATKFYHVKYPETWYASAIPWSETNSEAFAGTHEKHVLVVFDEASAIADVIWEVVEGAMTTPGAMWLCFGNPTRNDGKFYDCFNKLKHRWTTFKVDSRDAKMANRAQLDQWVEDYGDDSDFVRVRIKGEFPRQASTQFIPTDIVQEAQERKLQQNEYQFLSCVIGVDVARYGTDESVICIRQGDYVHPIQRFLGISTMELAGKVYDVYAKFDGNATVCVDGVGIGAGVVDRLIQLGVNTVDVQSAAKSLDLRTYSNKRAELWGKMKDWLTTTGSLPKDDDIYKQLISVHYGLNNKLQIQLQSKEEMRKQGKTSPDLADALAYTFAYDEAVRIANMTQARPVKRVRWV